MPTVTGQIMALSMQLYQQYLLRHYMQPMEVIRLKLQLLLGAEREQLVGRLLRLKASGRAVAALRQLRQGLRIVADGGDFLRRAQVEKNPWLST